MQETLEDTIEYLEEHIQNLELEIINLTRYYNQLERDIMDLRYNTKQELEFIKCDNKMLHDSIHDILIVLDSHYDKIHKIEIMPNLYILNNIKKQED